MSVGPVISGGWVDDVAGDSSSSSLSSIDRYGGKTSGDKKIPATFIVSITTNINDALMVAILPLVMVKFKSPVNFSILGRK